MVTNAATAAVPTAVISFVHDTTAADIPELAMAFAHRCLLDLLGVAAAGHQTDLSRIVHEHALGHFGAGDLSAPLLFDGRSVSPAGAALAGGRTIDSIDAHDGHKLTKGHTGCHQLPALLALTSAEGLDDPVVTTFHEAARLATPLPETTEQAQYSLPFPVAAAIARGRLTAAEISSEGLADREIHRLAQLVSIVESDAHNAAFPANRYASVSIALTDGRTLSSDDTEPRGDPEHHLSDDEVREKFRVLATPSIGALRADSIDQAVDGLALAGSLQPLFELIF